MISSTILSNKATTIGMKNKLENKQQKKKCICQKKVHSAYHYRMHFQLPSILPFTNARSLHTTSISYSNATTSPRAISLAFCFPAHPCYALNVNVLWTYSCMFINMNYLLASGPQWLVDNPFVLMSMSHHPFMYFYIESSNTMNVCHIPPHIANSCNHSYKDLLIFMFFTCLLQILLHFNKPLYVWFQISPQF